jgi:hypothetical protein
MHRELKLPLGARPRAHSGSNFDFSMTVFVFLDHATGRDEARYKKEA